jgi:hypothetical protein
VGLYGVGDVSVRHTFPLGKFHEQGQRFEIGWSLKENYTVAEFIRYFG